MIDNPLSKGISHIGDQFSGLEFSLSGFIPSLITAIVLIFVIIIFGILWPYGLIPIIEDLIRELMRNAKSEMNGKSTVAKMPFVVALGLYFIIWAPFAILCLPFLIFGVVGRIFSD